MLGFGQEDAWVYFTDKPSAGTYLSNPLTMLSQKSLDRRTAQNIALDNKDVPIHASYRNQVANSAGIIVMAKSKWMNALHVRGTVTAIQNLQNLAFVASVDFANDALNSNGSGRAQASNKNKQVDKYQESMVTFSYGNSNNQIQMLNGHLLHQQDYTGAGKTIAVLDAGFPGVDTAAPFDRLHDNNLILGGYNFVNNNANFYTGGSHGTLVLSAMGGYVASQLVGTAPDAHYYLFVTEDISSENPVEESYWVAAAEVADSLGVDIINTSLGYFGYDNPNYSYTYADMNGTTSFIARGADIAFSRGMICVASAGNSGGTANPNISTPADAVHTLAVGAVTASENYATFSSIGPSFDNRVKPDVAAQGQAAVLADELGTIITANGTSFSGPITAGMVACLWQALPGKTNAEIIQLIKESANLYNNPTNQLGYGIPDFNLAVSTALGLVDTGSNSFIVYPNPAGDFVHVGFPGDLSIGDILLYNSLGQLVLNQRISISNNDLSVTHLPQGLYLYHIVSGETTHTGKLIKK